MRGISRSICWRPRRLTPSSRPPARRFGRLDILVNNAGVNRRERIFDVSRESWDLISTIDLRIPYELSRAAARVMAEGDGGSIIQMGSLNNAIGLAGVSVYGAHKAGLCQLAKSMSVEWAEYKIRVNAICPGFVLTPLTTSVWADPVREKWLLDRTLWKRPCYPDDLVGLCLLLASNAGCLHHRPGDVRRGRLARRNTLGQDRLRSHASQAIRERKRYGIASISAKTGRKSTEPQGAHRHRPHRRGQSRPSGRLLLQRRDRGGALLPQDEARSEQSCSGRP